MDASIVDLRYKMCDVLKALDRREKVRILYHGKVKGEIIPLKSPVENKTITHSIFEMDKNEARSPADVVAHLRRKRVHAV